MVILWIVFPACAGMIPSGISNSDIGRRVPRMCGDDPNIVIMGNGSETCSPHVRG